MASVIDISTWSMHPAPVKSPSCQSPVESLSLQACPTTKIPPPSPSCLPIHPTLVIPGNILYKVSGNLELAILSYCSWRERCRSYMCELFCSLARFSLLFNLTIMSFFFFFTDFQQVGISVISKFFFHNCNFLLYSYLLLCRECIFISL